MYNRSGLLFLQTEIRTGLTTARIAQNAKTDSKKQRNREIARKAYDTVLHFIPRIEVPLAEAEKLQDQIKRLKLELERLGEEF